MHIDACYMQLYTKFQTDSSRWTEIIQQTLVEQPVQRVGVAVEGGGCTAKGERGAAAREPLDNRNICLNGASIRWLWGKKKPKLKQKKTLLA